MLGGCANAVLAAAFPLLGIGFVGGWALSRLLLFRVAPVVGAAPAGVTYRWVGGDEPGATPATGNPQG